MDSLDHVPTFLGAEKVVADRIVFVDSRAANRKAGK